METIPPSQGYRQSQVFGKLCKWETGSVKQTFEMLPPKLCCLT